MVLLEKTVLLLWKLGSYDYEIHLIMLFPFGYVVEVGKL